MNYTISIKTTNAFHIFLFVVFYMISPTYSQPNTNPNAIEGVNYASQGSLDIAMNFFEKALKTDPYEEHVIESMEILLEVADKKLERKTAIHYFKGTTYLNITQWDEAIVEYEKAIEINPKFANAYYRKGCAYDIGYQLDQAIADYNKAIELDPKYTLAYTARGMAYGKKGKVNKAITDFNTAIGINPKSASAYYNRGYAYYLQGQFDNAISDYTKVLDIYPKYKIAYDNIGGIYYEKGLAYVKEGRYDQALSALSKAIEINPLDGEAFFERGSIYFKQGRFVEAIIDYIIANKIEPTVSTQSNIGSLYAALGDFQNALEWYRKAAAQGDAVSQYGIGLYYLDGSGVKKNYDEAFNWFQKAADQGYPPAQYNLGLMYFNGYSISKDFSQAYFWFELSSKGYKKFIAEGFDAKIKKKDAIFMSKKAAKKLTRAQKKAVKQMLNTWRPVEE